MAKQFSVDVVTKQHADKLEIVETDVVADPGPNFISIAFGDDVPEHRAVEILNAWRWLWNGVRDRGLLDAQFVGAILITGVGIDHLNVTDRRTSSTVGDFATDDVLLTVGAGVATGPDTGRTATNRLESGFAKLREYANENFFNVN